MACELFARTLVAHVYGVIVHGRTHPVTQQESRLLGETTIIEDQEEFSSIRTQPLQRMRVPGREVPEVTLLQVIHKTAPIGI